MNWLEIARELQAMGQTGLHFTKDPYDAERYARLQQIAAAILAENSNLSTAQFLAWNENEFGYATPKIDVRGFVLQHGKVLLVRENLDAGRWTLPGGWADVNQTPAESVVREIREESGYETRVLQLLAVLDRERQKQPPPLPFHIHKLFFHCEITGGAPAANIESSECGFFGVDELPELSVSRVTEQQIRRLFHKVQSGDPRTDFD